MKLNLNSKFLIAISIFCNISYAKQAWSQKYLASDIPAELLGNADEVVRFASTDFEVKGPSDATETTTRVVTVLNKNSHENVLVEYYDAYSKITVFKATIYDKTGRVVKTTSKQDVQDMSAYDGFSIYSDNRVKVIEIAYNNYPYTIECQVEKTYKELLNYPNWHILDSYRQSVQETTHKITLPKDLDIVYKNFNTEVSPTETTDAKGRKQYEWRSPNIAAIEREPFAPPATRVLPSVHISPVTFEVKGYQGSMASWKDFGQFIYELNKDNDALSPEMKATVAELTASLPNDTEKIAALYKYLQNNMRYVSVQWGIGGWQSFDAKYVEKNKYGDCKALTWFMKALLKEASIKAQPALITAGDTPYEHQANFTEPNFNHVILHVPSTGQWLECTSNTAPCGYFTSLNEDRSVLLITEEGGQLARTPKLPACRSIQRVQLALDPEGNAAITSKTEMTGEAHEYYRRYQNDLSDTRQKEILEESLSLPSYKVGNFKVDVAADAPSATFEYEINAFRFASKAGTRLFVPMNALEKVDFVPKEIKKRHLPVYMRASSETESEVTLLLPEGYKIEALPKAPPNVHSEFGDYSLNISAQDKQLVLHRQLTLKPYEGKADDYEKLRDFFKTIQKSDAIKVVLVKE
jgi:hypothetical protein